MNTNADIDRRKVLYYHNVDDNDDEDARNDRTGQQADTNYV